MVDRVHGIISIRPALALIPDGPGSIVSKSLCLSLTELLKAFDEVSNHIATSIMKLSCGVKGSA
jgi:hypothetical protein